MRILIIRNDGIGDLILTFPAISAIRRLYTDAHIAIFVGNNAKELLWNNPDINEIIVDNKEGVFTLAKRLYKRFDIAFVFYPNWRNSLISFLAGIPTRIGTGYKFHSIFFNKRVYVHKRNYHEADWCLKIVGSNETAQTPRIFIKDCNLEYAKKLLSDNGILGNLIIGIHPGCKGSALNWTEEGYARLIGWIEEKYGIRTIITGRASDKQMIERIISKTKGNPLILSGITNLTQLIALISLYSLFIGPSTGPMHIASCLGIKTIALFPPIGSQSPKKWHPLGENYTIFTPDIICRENKCKGLRCKEYNCMEIIKQERILEEIKGVIAQHIVIPKSNWFDKIHNSNCSRVEIGN